MKDKLNQLRLFAINITKTAKVRKRLLAVAAVLVVLQLYFVRELIAAELLFGLGFTVLFFLVALFYLVGALGEGAIDATKAGARVVAASVHRVYSQASPVFERVAQRSAIIIEAAVKSLAQSARHGYRELGVIGERAFDAIQVALREAIEWTRLEYIRAKPSLEASSRRSVVVVEAGVRVLAHSARRGYQRLEEISKKPFRHPRSESAR